MHVPCMQVTCFVCMYVCFWNVYVCYGMCVIECVLWNVYMCVMDCLYVCYWDVCIFAIAVLLWCQ